MTMTRYRLSRRAALGLIGAAARVGADRVAGTPRQCAGPRQGELPDELARPGRAWRLLPGRRRRHLQEARLDVDAAQGGPQLEPSQLLLGGRVDMVDVERASKRSTTPRENLPFCASRAIFQKDPQVLIAHPGVGNDTLREAQGQADPDRRRRRRQLLAVPEGEVRLHRRADAALHLQPGAVPGRQEPGRSRASSRASPTPCARPASIRWSC